MFIAVIIPAVTDTVAVALVAPDVTPVRVIDSASTYPVPPAATAAEAEVP